jgi:hypothetical protein
MTVSSVLHETYQSESPQHVKLVDIGVVRVVLFIFGHSLSLVIRDMVDSEGESMTKVVEMRGSSTN